MRQRPWPAKGLRSHKRVAAEAGRVTANNGDIQMTVLWEDAPADYKIRGKSIIGQTMDFTVDEFKAAYTVHKREKPRVVGGQGGDN